MEKINYSLWDPLCEGTQIPLWLSKSAVEKVVIPSEELLIENKFYVFTGPLKEQDTIII